MLYTLLLDRTMVGPPGIGAGKHGMSVIVHILFLCTYAVAAIALAVSLPGIAAIGDEDARTIGVVVFALLGLFHALRHSERARQGAEAAVEGIYRQAEDEQRRLEDLEGQFARLEETVEERAEKKNAELVAEMQVLQTLLARVASQSVSAGSSPESVLNRAKQSVSVRADDDAGSSKKLLEIIENALEDNRLDLYVQPIVSLPQRRVRYLEVFSRVRDEVGRLIYPADYLDVAERAGLIVTLDNLLLFRCIKLIRQLRERDGDLACFVNVSAATLVDENFFPQFLEFVESASDLKSKLIFEFSQADISRASPALDRNIGALTELGFGFSMDRISSLDFDFQGLAERGFKFVKVPASLLKADPGPISSEDLNDAMQRSALDLIVDKIESEPMLVEVLDFGVDYGQGFLFGEPQPSRLANPHLNDGANLRVAAG